MSARKKILDAALQEMSAKGADATSLRMIADAVGIKTPSIMYHFPTKDALRKAVLEEQLSRWNDVLPTLIMATSRDGNGRFEALTAELSKFFLEEPARARLIMRELMDRPEEMQLYLNRYIAPWIQLIAEQVQLARSKGNVSGDVDATAFVWVMVTSVMANAALAESIRLEPIAESGPTTQTHTPRLTQELIRMARSSLFSSPLEPHHSQKGESSYHGKLFKR